jgi:hypothetical protein
MNIQSLFVTALAASLFVSARATPIPDVPSGTPVFSNPLTIDNTYFPFLTGQMKESEGAHGGVEVNFFESFTTATRDFAWNGGVVRCRVLEEIEYEDGELVELSKNYFAQADDGTVYYFGEVVDVFDGGTVAHPGSWLVGGPTLPTDPPGTATAPAPNVFMPDNPERGDRWKPENLFPIVDETVVVVQVGKSVVVPYGSFSNVVRVEESSALSSGTTSKWYAPGVGFVMSKEPGETLRLESIEP